MLCGVWRTLELLWRGGIVTLLCDATTNFVATSTVPIDVTFSYWILSYCTSFPPIVSCVALEVCVRLSYWDKFYHNSINPVPGGCNRDRTVLYKNWSFVHNIGGWGVLQGFIIKVYWVDSMMQNIAVRQSEGRCWFGIVMLLDHPSTTTQCLGGDFLQQIRWNISLLCIYVVWLFGNRKRQIHNLMSTQGWQRPPIKFPFYTP